MALKDNLSVHFNSTLMLTATRFLRKVLRKKEGELETYLDESDRHVTKLKEDVAMRDREITELKERIYSHDRQHEEECEIQNHQVSIWRSCVVK